VRCGLDITGISTVAGNASAKQAAINVKGVLTALGVNTDVLIGSESQINRKTNCKYIHGKYGAGRLHFGMNSKMSRGDTCGILKKLSDSKRVDVLCLGPLTNIAIALGDKKSARKINRLIITGGTLNSKGDPDFHGGEYNFYADQQAAEEVLANPIEKLIIGWDPIEKMPFDWHKISRVSGKGSKEIESLLNFWDGMLLFDVITAASLIDEGIASFKKIDVKHEQNGKLKKVTSGYEIKWCTEINEPRFYSLLEKVICKPKMVIFSPHIDDAYLSLGGTIVANNDALVKIINVFSTSNYRLGGGKKNIEEITTCRKGEEKQNSMETSVLTEFWDYPEVFVRGYPNWQTAPSGRDAKLEKELFVRIKEKIRNEGKNTRFFFPLSIGGHVDHILLARMGLRLMGEADISFYEDLPYAAFKKLNILSLDIKDKLQSEEINIDEFINEKIKLCKNYSSQIRAQDIYAIKKYAKSINKEYAIERIWKKPLTRDYVKKILFEELSLKNYLRLRELNSNEKKRLENHFTSMRKHSIACAAVMETLAKRFDKDAKTWWQAGMLHEIDYPQAFSEMSLHCKAVAAIARKYHITEDIIRASQNHESPETPKNQLDVSLYATCKSVKFIVHCVRASPQRKLSCLKMSFVNKLLYDRNFEPRRNERLTRFDPIAESLPEFLKIRNKHILSCRKIGFKPTEFLRVVRDSMLSVNRKLRL
jgi:putative nucleotidyltransferase with HDIG domain